MDKLDHNLLNWKDDMAGSRIFSCAALIFFLLFSNSPPASSEGIAPERDISVVYDAPVVPDWKVLWDGARALVRDQHFELAAKAYSQLFQIKPNIEEASWEYCKVLMRIEDYHTASTILTLLLEINPTRSDYLLVAGQVAARDGKFLDAEKYFGKVFAISPLGTLGTTALEGLAYSLRARGQTQRAFPLLKQLLVRQPDNARLVQELAEDAVVLHEMTTAQFLYSRLLKDPEVSEHIIFQAAEVFAKTGNEKEKIAAWKRYLQKNPDYQPFRLGLIEYYTGKKQYRKVLNEYDYLINHSADGSAFLLEAAKLALNEVKRPDRALVYFSKYARIFPNDLAVSEKIEAIEGQLARELLAIVENDGAEMLWQDLQRISPNRESIFRHMAGELQAKKKYLALVNVLEVLYEHGQSRDTTALQLGRLLHGFKQYERSRVYLETLPDSMRDIAYYRLQGENYNSLGLEFKAFTSFYRGLQLEPGDIDLGHYCLQLAGSLGLVDAQKELFVYLLSKLNAALPFELVMTHLQMLMINGMYDDVLHKSEWALQQYRGEKQKLLLIFLKTDALRKAGKGRFAEQLLRSLLREQEGRGNVLLRLARNSIEDGELEMAGSWLKDITNKRADHIELQEELTFAEELQLAQVMLYRKAGALGDALELLDQRVQSEREGVRGKPSLFSLRSQEEKCQIFAEQKKFEDGLAFCKPSAGERFSVKLYAAKEDLLLRRTGERELGQLQLHLYKKKNLEFTKVISVIEHELKEKKYKRARHYLDLLGNDAQGSVRYTRAKADLETGLGDYEKAKTLISGLKVKYDDETTFCKALIDLETRGGNYSDGLALFKDCFGEGFEQRFFQQNPRKDYDLVLLYARLLWGDKKQEKALSLYRQLLDPPIYKKLIAEFGEKNINYQYLTRNQTFWNSMMLLMESEPDIIAELMEPDFLVDNVDNDTGAVISQNFAEYSWQNLISNEYSARQAIYNRNYHFAAKSYEKLLAKEETKESKVDLATIYGRIGQYRKEAQVYEEISKEGEITPELEESIQRNVLQIRPTNTIDFDLNEREGRAGFVDMRKKSLGTSFWFTPMLNQDFWFSYENTLYQSTDRDEEVGANSLLGAMNYEFEGGYELRTEIGTEKVNSAGDSLVHYNFELRGKLDDYVSGTIQYKKESVEDSVEAVKEGVYRQFLKTGLSIETEFGIAFGSDLRYSIYSDDNDQKRFSFFSSYSLFGDTTQFDIRYDYQYLFNKDYNDGVGRDSRLFDDDYIDLYWSPETYSEHRLGVQVKKDFFGYLTDIENKMSYFLFDTGVSLEDEENLTYSAGFNIFLEMSPHLLLKGNFSFNTSDVYEEKILSLSLHYSW